jgi:hypothetical protein
MRSLAASKGIAALLRRPDIHNARQCLRESKHSPSVGTARNGVQATARQEKGLRRQLNTKCGGWPDGTRSRKGVPLAPPRLHQKERARFRVPLFPYDKPHRPPLCWARRRLLLTGDAGPNVEPGVHIEHLAGDSGGIIREQKDRGFPDFRGFDVATQRRHLDAALEHVGETAYPFG